MKKTSVQFHITIKEMMLFIEEIVSTNELKCYGYIYFPENQIIEIMTFSLEEIKKYNEIWISHTEKIFHLVKKIFCLVEAEI